MLNRNIGKMAEGDFERWAGQVNITANRSNQDREGWDFFVQVPYDYEPSSGPVDRRESRIECLVQVKGISKTRKRISIELSTWERLIKTHLPAFFLVTEYGDSFEAQNAFLIHVGHKHIEKVLKRLRELGEAESDKINKKFMDLTWNHEHRLSELNGVGLVRAIKDTLPEGMKAYTLQKLDLLETIGNPIPALIKLSIQADQEHKFWSQLVDFSIGIQDSIHVSEIQLEKDIRFNSAAETIIWVGGRFKFTPNDPIVGKLVFKNSHGTRKAEFDAEFRTPQQFIHDIQIPPQYVKERAIFDAGEAIIWPMVGRLTVNVNYQNLESLRSVKEHSNFWQLTLILKNAEAEGGFLEILDNDGQTLTKGTLADIDSEKLNINAIEIAQVVESMHYLSRLFDTADCKMELEQIMAQEKMINFVRALCDPDISIGPLIWTHQETEVPVKEVAIPFARTLSFGTTKVFVLVALSGNVKIERANEDSVQLVIEKPRRIRLRHFKIDDSKIGEEVLFNNFIDDLESNGFDCVIFSAAN